MGLARELRANRIKHMHARCLGFAASHPTIGFIAATSDIPEIVRELAGPSIVQYRYERMPRISTKEEYDAYIRPEVERFTKSLRRWHRMLHVRSPLDDGEYERLMEFSTDKPSFYPQLIPVRGKPYFGFFFDWANPKSLLPVVPDNDQEAYRSAFFQDSPRDFEAIANECEIEFSGFIESEYPIRIGDVELLEPRMAVTSTSLLLSLLLENGRCFWKSELSDGVTVVETSASIYWAAARMLERLAEREEVAPSGSLLRPEVSDIRTLESIARRHEVSLAKALKMRDAIVERGPLTGPQLMALDGVNLTNESAFYARYAKFLCDHIGIVKTDAGYAANGFPQS